MCGSPPHVCTHSSPCTHHVAHVHHRVCACCTQELWGWRVPFLLCLPLGGVLLFFQCTLEESSDFEAAVKAAEERRGGALASDKEGGAPAFLVRQRSFTFLGPLCQLVQEWGLHLLIAFLLSSGSCVMGYGTGTGFAKDFLDESLERPIIFAGNAALIIAFANSWRLALVLMGYWRRQAVLERFGLQSDCAI